jgi:hypothetical protein
MIEHTTRYATTVRHSHTRKTTVAIYDAQGMPLVEDARISEGNLIMDDTDIRTSATFTFNDPDMTPSDTNELLRPGHEIIPSTGIKYADGTEELFQLGVLGIADTRVDDSGDGYNLRVDTYDRGRKLSRARLPNAYRIPKDSVLTYITQDILQWRYPDIKMNIPDLDLYTTAVLLEMGADPWVELRKLWDAQGYELYFDRFGEATVKQVAVEPNEYAWEFEDGELSLLIYIYKQLSDERAYSRVVVTGESTSNLTPVRAEAMDLQPNSPTYIYGDFGDVPYFESSPLIRTAEQAQAAADKRLLSVIGFTESFELLAGPNPVLELGDLIHVTRAQSSTDHDYVISKITVPLIYERGMNISGRLRRVLS